MKKRLPVLLAVFLLAVPGFSQTLQDSLSQARTSYSRGQYQEAISLIDLAASTYATSYENKALVADAFNAIGESEYSRKNYLNAYECFRRAVKISPTHKAASDNFWKIKQNFDVTALRNEGTAVASSDRSATSDGSASGNNPAATGTTFATGTGSDTGAAQTEEIRKYQAELAEQSRLIRELQANYTASRTSSSAVDPALLIRQQEILANMEKVYASALSAKGTTDIDIFTAQMKQYQEMFSIQQASQFNLVLIVIISFAGFVLIGVLVLVFLYRLARRRQRQRFAYASDYGMGIEEHAPLGLSEQSPLLLPQESLAFEGGPKEDQKKGKDAESDFYRDIIRSERLKEMANEKKYGTLKWDTVREYIGELEKELRSEILYVVENKLNSWSGEDYSAVLPVLFPFLTDSDEYLRDKASTLLQGALSKSAATDESYLQIEYDQAGKKKGRDPLSVASLMKHVDKLKNIKPARREHSNNVARYVRGMAMVLNMPNETQELLYKTALVHDIGYAILDKKMLDAIAEKKDLTEKEEDFIQTHPQKGVDYFSDLDIPEEMEQGILYHHERNDGTGYPEGLEGNDIPVFAKIIGIADIFDALTTSRVFREKMGFDAALLIIRDLGRKKLDDQYLQALIEYLKRSGQVKR